MADKKITEFTEALSVADPDILTTVESPFGIGSNRKITFQNFKKYLPKEPTFVVGAGENCDYTDIQSAINDLPDTGGLIFVRKGTYVLTSTIQISKSNVYLQGEGKNTIIQRETASDIDLFTIGDGLNPYSDISIRGFTIDGNNEDGSYFKVGILVKDFISRLDISENSFIHNLYYWIVITSSGTGCIIAKNYILDRCGSCVIQSLTGLIFKDNIFDSTAIKAISANNLKDCVISDNNFSVRGSYVVPTDIFSFSQCKNLSIKGNVFSDCEDTPLSISNSTFVSVVANVFAGNKFYSCNIQSSHYGVFGNNNIYKSMRGFYLYQSSGFAVTGNTILSCQSQGIYVQQCSEITVSSNIIQDTPISAVAMNDTIRLDQASMHCAVIGNTVVMTDGTSRRFGICEYANGTDYNLIGHNIIRGVFYRHVYAFGRNSIVDQNILHYV